MLFLWLLLAQTIAALFSVLVMLVVLILLAMGIQLQLLGHTPLWEWIACGVPICLYWLAMGRIAPYAARPGPVGIVAVLTVWGILTSLMRNMYLILFVQRTCGGMLEEILGCEGGLALTIACFLLPAALGMGLLLGRGEKKGLTIGWK